MRVSNTAIGIGLIIFAVAVLFYTRTFPTLEKGYPGPSLFPNVLAVLFIISGITLVVQGIRSGERILRFETSGITGSGLINILLALGAIFFYIFLSDFLGFQITSFILLFGLMKWLRVSTPWSLVMACGVTLAIYVLFAKILLVALPWGLWGW
jgi:putative tricarboxylic transport membrane protein